MCDSSSPSFLQDWSFATISIDEIAGTVTGRVSSLSPVVATVVSDGTFGPAYLNVNPFARIVDISITGDSISLFDSNGMRLETTATPIKIRAGETLTVSNSIKNIQRESQTYTYIVEVFDSKGVAVDIIQQPGTLDAGEVKDIASPWKVVEIGSYTFKIFVIEESSSATGQILKNSALAGTVEVMT